MEKWDVNTSNDVRWAWRANRSQTMEKEFFCFTEFDRGARKHRIRWTFGDPNVLSPGDVMFERLGTDQEQAMKRISELLELNRAAESIHEELGTGLVRAILWAAQREDQMAKKKKRKDSPNPIFLAVHVRFHGRPMRDRRLRRPKDARQKEQW